MKVQNSTEQKLTRARTQLLLNQPFFGTLCLRLKLVSGSVPTMATDGRRIAFNPAFVDELKPAELEATLAHEVMHCALGHHCRRGERDPRLWNEAADLAINPILVGNGFTLPTGALIDSSFSDLSAEEIYARLLRDKNDQSDSGSKQTPQQGGNGGGGTTQNQQQPQRGQPPATGSNSQTQRVSSQGVLAPGQAQESCAVEHRSRSSCTLSEGMRKRAGTDRAASARKPRVSAGLARAPARLYCRDYAVGLSLESAESPLYRFRTVPTFGCSQQRWRNRHSRRHFRFDRQPRVGAVRGGDFGDF